MGDNPTAHLFAELLHALHDESDALVANDSARLVDAAIARTICCDCWRRRPMRCARCGDPAATNSSALRAKPLN